MDDVPGCCATIMAAEDDEAITAWCAVNATAAKKSELLRAGIKALAAMNGLGSWPRKPRRHWREH